MANNSEDIVSRIKVEGGAAATAELDKFGKTGQTALEQVKEAADKLTAASGRLADSVSKIGKIDTGNSAEGLNETAAAADRATSSLKQTSDAGQQLQNQDWFTIAKGVVAGQLAFTGLLESAKAAYHGIQAVLTGLSNGASDTASKIQDTADKLKLLPSQLQGLESRASDVDSLRSALGNLDKALEDSTSGFKKLGGSTSEFFQTFSEGMRIITVKGAEASEQIVGMGERVAIEVVRMGQAASSGVIEIDKLNLALRRAVNATHLGLDRVDILFEIARAIDQIRDPLKQAEAGLKFFGKSWKEFTELSREGREEFRKAAEGARIFSDSMIKVGNDLKKARNEFDEAVKFFKDSIGLLFAGPRTVNLEWMTKFIDEVRKLTFAFIGADEAKQKLFNSGKFDFFKDFDLSKFEEFLKANKMEAFAEVIKKIRSVCTDLVSVWENGIVPAGEAVAIVFSGLVGLFNEAFGTKVTEQFALIVLAIGTVFVALGGLKLLLLPFSLLFSGIGLAFGALLVLLTRGGSSLEGVFAGFGTAARAVFTSIRESLGGLGLAFQEFGKGNFALAWALFKLTAIKAIDEVKLKFKSIFTGVGESGPLSGLIKTFNLLEGAATIAGKAIKAVFGFDPGAGGVAALLLIGGLTGAFTALGAAARILAFALTPIGAAFIAIASAAIILTRLFPDVGASLDLMGSAFSKFVSGNFSGALADIQAAFQGFWTNLSQEGPLTFGILAVAAGLAFAAIRSAAVSAFAIILAHPLVALVAAFAVATGLIIAYWDEIKAKIAEVSAAQDAYNAKAKNEGVLGPLLKNFTAGTNFIADKVKQLLEILNPLSSAGAAEIGAPKLAKSWDQILEEAKQKLKGVETAVEETKSKTGGQEIEAPKTSLWSRMVEEIRAKFQAAEGEAKTGADKVAKAGDLITDSRGQVSRVPFDNEKIKQNGDATITIVRGTVTEIINVTRTATQALESAFDETGFIDAANVTAPLEEIKLKIEETKQKLGEIQSPQIDLSSITASIDSLNQTVQGVGPVFDGLTVAASSSMSAIDANVQQTSSAITSATEVMIAQLNAVIQRAADAIAAVKQAQGAAGAGNAGGGLAFAGGGRVFGPGSGTSDSIPAWLSSGEFVHTARATRHYGLRFMQAINSLRFPRFAGGGVVGGVTGGSTTTTNHTNPKTDSNQNFGRIENLLESIGKNQGVINETIKTLKDVLDQILETLKAKPASEDNKESKVVAAIDKVTAAIDILHTQILDIGRVLEARLNTIIQKLVELIATQQDTGGGTALARGGPVWGAGTGTSDSIAARLSHGEYVHNARATRHYGRHFMDAVNSMRLPKFALGGLVDAVNTPLGFAGGGPSIIAAGGSSGGGGRPLTLVLDGRQFGGLTGPSKTMRDLENHAKMRQLKSTGVKPSWNRG